MITVTVDKINGVDKTNDIRGIQSSDVVAGSLRPLTANTTSSAAIFKVQVPNASSPSGFEIQEWQVTETYAAILSALTQDAAESGAQLIANLVTSISGSSTDAQYPSAKLLYDQLVLKQNLLLGGQTTLVAGVRQISATGITANSEVFVQRIVTGGTAAVGGYKVTIDAVTETFTITALQVDCVTTETSNTDQVHYAVRY